jgi:hypothetical protein
MMIFVSNGQSFDQYFIRIDLDSAGKESLGVDRRVASVPDAVSYAITCLEPKLIPK